MNKLFDKQIYSIEDIEQLIANQAEENLNLEFKSSDSLDFNDPKLKEKNKIELSKDVSAMANSDGGLIIYGIREKNHVAKSKTFIDGNIVTKERIEQIIQSRIKRRITSFEVIPVRENDDFKKSFYIIKIHESEDSPHMAYDGVYYKRNNFNVIKYMEYEVRREYLRIRKSNLEIEFPIINDTDGKFHKYGKSELGHFRIWFHVKNTGKIFEENFKQEIQIPKSIHNDYYITPNPIQKFKTHTLPTKHKFSIPSSQIIYPDEQLRLCSSYIFLKEGEENEEIKMKLYYSSGIKEKTFSIREMFDNQYKLEEETNFELKYQEKT